MGRKLDFSISETRLERSLEELHKLNLVFTQLVSQTSRLHEKERSFIPDDDRVKSKKKIEEYQMIQNASGRLFSALSRACAVHNEHSTQFRLDSQLVSPDNSGITLVRFNMSFAPRDRDPALEPVWISVDSSFDDIKLNRVDTFSKPLNGLPKVLKREVESDFNVQTQKIQNFEIDAIGFSELLSRATAPCHLAHCLPRKFGLA